MIQPAQTVIAPYLDPGERLLWSGQPLGGVRFRAQDAILIPFSLVWGGFAVFWETMALTMVRGHAPFPISLVFPLFGLPFVAVGLYMIFGRFFVDARTRARTFYGVTNERVIILSGLFSRQVKSLQLRTLSDVSLNERSDGSGTISFGATNPFSMWMGAGASWPGAGRFAPPAFDLIERARIAYNIIRDAQRQPSVPL